MNQLSEARSMLRKAQDIGDELKDEYLLFQTAKGFEHINEKGKELHQNKVTIGPKTDCSCGSGKPYEDCCGQADFEPIEFPVAMGFAAEEMDTVSKKYRDAGKETSRLDFIFRQTAQSNLRTAWTRTKVDDGWLELRAFPDMANYHLFSAKALCEESKDDPNSVTKPLSCLILSVCALEAFINQVAFFLHDVQQFHEVKLYSIPDELKGDAFEFQRNNELSMKWDILGKSLCGKFWPPSGNLWSDFVNLIYIRNELIHFKIDDFEQIIPPPKKKSEIYKRVPKSANIRDVPQTWPERILTPEYAKWCVNVAEIMIQNFKNGYEQNRLAK